MSSVAELARGRWNSILTGLGVPDHVINGKHQACPSCGGKDRFRYTNKDDRGMFFCSNCGSGDGVDLLMNIFGWDFKSAALEIEAFMPSSVAHQAPKKKDPRILLRHIASKRVDGTEVAGYLSKRGLKHCPDLKQADLSYYEDGNFIGNYMAMVAMVVDVNNDPVSFHITYLKDRVKANVTHQKKIMPGIKSVTGCAVRLGGCGERISVTEGIETGLAIHDITGRPVFAALTANGMASLEIPEIVKSVDIYADNDRNFTGHLAAYKLANRLVLAGLDVNVYIPDEVGTDYADKASDS